MKKFLIPLAFLPFSLFGAFNLDGFAGVRVSGVYLFTWSDFDKTPTRLNVPYYQVDNEDQLYSAFASGSWGFKFQVKKLTATGMQYTIRVPSFTFNPSASANYTSISNCVVGTTNGFIVTFTPLVVPRVSALYQSAATLFAEGYRGVGVSWYQSFGTSSNFCVNVNYPLLLSDVLSSTNTLYRQILLSHLNSIQASVASIDSGVSALAPDVSAIRSVNTSMLSSIDASTNILTSLDLNIENILESVHSISTNAANNPFVSDFAGSINALVDIGTITQSQAQLLINQFDQLGSNAAKILFALQVQQQFVDKSFTPAEFIQQASQMENELLTIGSFLNMDVVDALIGDYDQTRGGFKAVNTRTSIKSQLAAWKAEAKKQLQDWQDDLKADLQAWKTSDETGYLNVQQHIDAVVEGQAAANSYINTLFDPGNLDRNPHALNYVVSGITNSNSRDISNLSRDITNALDNLKNSLLDPNRQLDVRISYPLRYESTDEVNVHDADVVDAIRNGYININELKSAILEALNTSDPSVRIKGTNSVDWLPWFEKWDPYSSLVTNYYSEYNSSAPVADLASRFLSDGFDIDAYNDLPWFSRVEVLLAMIADTSTNSVDVADVQDELNDLVDDFKDLGTNVVSSSESFVGLFDYLKRTANSFKLVFGDRSAPVTGSGITLLPAGSWIGNEPLVLRVDTTVQNVLRLFFRCFWLLSALVALWLSVSWSWQKVLAVLRWLWSMFDL